MVLIALALLGAGALAFFSAGGVKRVQAFAESIPTTTDMKTGTSVIPTIESGEGTVPIASGSQRTVNDIEVQTVVRTNVVNKHKFSPFAEQPPIQTIFNNPKQGGNLSQQRGTIVGTNLSLTKTSQFGTGKFGLSEQEITTIRSQDFTDQERQDIANLTLRFNRKTVSAQKVSDSPEEIIFKKREQEALAKRLLEANLGVGSFTTVPETFTPAGFSLTGGKPTQAKLFAKPNFIFGGVSEEVFLEQRREKAEEFARIQENARLQQERQRRGEVIEIGIAQSGETQREFLLSRGIKLTGSALNAKALARLQEKGLI